LRAWLGRLFATPQTDGDRARTVVGTFVLHFRPVRVPAATIRFTHTFGLGGMSLVLLGILVVTGSLLMLGYTPVPGEAYASIERLEREVVFGAFIRSLHYWSANLLVLVAGLHLLRVVFTGGFLDGRALNWVVGLVLLAAIAASSFTGYLLPWDQLAYWAVTIVTGMAGYVPLAGGALAELLRGGAEIGPGTLGTYYALHTQWLPALLLVGALFHFWRVRRAGGVVLPPDAVLDERGKPEQVLFLPHLLWREAAVALLLLAAVSLFAALVRAPLGPPANPGLSPNPA
jgi:quinol-cytochrome oxidoreductase complex cytochrome b subunit